MVAVGHEGQVAVLVHVHRDARDAGSELRLVTLGLLSELLLPRFLDSRCCDRRLSLCYVLCLLEDYVSRIKLVHAVDRQAFFPAKIAGFLYSLAIEQVPSLVLGDPLTEGLFVLDLGNCFPDNSRAAQLTLGSFDLGLVEGLYDVFFDALLLFLQSVHVLLELTPLGAGLESHVDAIADLFWKHGRLPCFW